MAKLDDLVARVTEASLRREMEATLAEMKKRQRFGILFEEHIPETTALRGLPVQVGSLVQRREDPEARLWKVAALTPNGRNATIASTANPEETQSVAARDLLVVKRFGEAAYPSLKPIAKVKRAEGRPFHAVIKGENFHALQLLMFQFEGQVDCIYIDPPYNTGSKDWKYNNHYVDKNDAWRHSKWLSMMEKRLKLAKRLLKPDGVLICTIDKNEHAHLVMLLERVFRATTTTKATDAAFEITSISIVHNPRGAQGDNFSHTNEYAVYVTPRGKQVIAARQLTEEERKKNTSNLRNWGGESGRFDAATCFYPVLVKGDAVVGFGDVPADEFHPPGAVVERAGGISEIWPIDENGVEKKWRYSRTTVESIRELLVVKRARNGDLAVHIAKETGGYKTAWADPKYDASSHGTQLVNKLVGVEFPYPKSLYATYEALYSVVIHKPDALVLDFFAGSGTTLHALALLNTADGGRRRGIVVTNNEVEEEKAKELSRAGHLPGDDQYERHGIFHAITWPRVKAAFEGRSATGEALDGTYLMGDARPWADGFQENVEAFEMAYLDPDEVDLGRQYAAIVPLLWLGAGAVGEREIEAPAGKQYSIPTGAAYGVLFKEGRFERFRAALEERPTVRRVWLVTDSESAFADMRGALPRGLRVGMLYRDYLRTFAINMERNLL